jgi:putative ABC transport system ATP-binding protein
MNGQEVYNNCRTGIDVRRFRRENIGFIFQQHNRPLALFQAA